MTDREIASFMRAQAKAAGHRRKKPFRRTKWTAPKEPQTAFAHGRCVCGGRRFLDPMCVRCDRRAAA